jgi:predicted extracellular nuclease
MINRTLWVRFIAIIIILAMVMAFIPAYGPPAFASTVVAYDMVGSTSQNLISYTNAWTGAFGSAGDGFQKYQRFVSSTIPFSVLDDSLSIFTSDSLGIIKEGNTYEFFGATDTVNGDNSGPVSATWVFNISGASDLSLSIDMGAMGDFESSDYFVWKYSIDGGATQTSFASTVDEAGSHKYTLEGGASFTLNDPMLVDGTVLTNDLQTFTTMLSGTGSELTLTLTASTNGGTEAFAFQNIVINGMSGASAPVIASCGGDLTLIEGLGGSREVSASDADGIVTDAYLPVVGPEVTINAVTPGDESDYWKLINVQPAPGIGGTLLGTVSFTDTIPVAPEGYFVRVGFANNDAVPQTAECSFAVQVVEFIPIYEIQGSSQFSPYEGQVVATTGIVTLITDDGRDMWIQDPVGDGDPQTSDGILVNDRDRLPDPKPQVGDLVRIVGEVEEQQFGNALPRTRIDDPDDYPFEILSSGNLLPVLVPLADLPNESIQEGEGFWEPLEGMLVSVENAPVVAPTNRFGEFAMLAKDDAKPGSGFFPQQLQILIGDLSQYPNEVDYNPERILVDDASLEAAIVVKPGDRMRSLVGVVDYTFGNYKLQPANFDVFTHNLPNLPASKRSGSNGNTVITTFNVENLFDLELNTPRVQDSLGQVGVDPGSGWGPPSTQNNTLVRKPEVCQGDSNPSDPFDPSLEWTGVGNNNFDDLGTHTVTCGSTSGLIISEYIEGSSLNKALEIYNGTGAAVNLATSSVSVQIFFNGSTTAGQTIQLSGTLADGDVFVLANPGADQSILDVTDQTSGGVLFNGDDAVTLNFGGKDDAGSTPDPDELETQLTKLALAIEVELRLPEIIVVQEIENQAIAQELADRVNAANGTSYVATSFETSDGRGIEPGFLWDENRVGLLDAYQMSGPDVDEWFGPSSTSPGREPIVGVFDINGQTVTIIGNHFKSKGGDDPLYGINWPPFRATEIQRKGQARVVRDFVSGILDADPDALVMVTGDLNDFQFGEPGENEIGIEPGHPLSILEGGDGEVPLTNLLYMEKSAETFTFVFDGNSQVLDHMLVSPALLEMTVAADILHFNAGFPSDLGEDASTPLRASDHDPLEGRFKIK